MNKLSFTIVFGSFFAFTGLVAMTSCLMASNGQTEAIIFGLVFGGAFIVIGVAVASIGLRAQMRIARARKNGTHYLAKIWEYDADYRVTINGMPTLVLVIRFFDSSDTIRQERVETGGVSGAKYPLGNTVEVSEYEGRLYLLSKKAVNEKIPREHELMNAYVQSFPPGVGMTAAGTIGNGNMPAPGSGMTAADVMQNVSGTPLAGTAQNAAAMQPDGITDVGVPVSGTASAESMMIACPSCGNILRMLPGSSVQCSCGRQITLTYDRVIS